MISVTGLTAVDSLLWISDRWVTGGADRHRDSRTNGWVFLP